MNSPVKWQMQYVGRLGNFTYRVIQITNVPKYSDSKFEWLVEVKGKIKHGKSRSLHSAKHSVENLVLEEIAKLAEKI